MRERPSWEITEGNAQELTVALYVRDALGVHSSDVAIPLLAPHVDVAVGPRTNVVITPDRWTAWWNSMIQNRGLLGPTDDLKSWIKSNAPSPEFGRALDEILPLSFAWTEMRKVEDLDHFQWATRENRLIVHTIVSSIEQERNRSANAFTLHIDTLPVEGCWFLRLDEHSVLLSRELRRDPVKFDEVIRPIISEHL